MAEDPEWAIDIFERETDIAINALNYLEQSGVRFDGAWIYGDIAYNHAPFFSPRMYRQQIKPAHARQVAWFKERGLPVIYHTDGDFRLLIPDMIEIGIDCIQPLEAKAHMDLRELKPLYGDKLTFMGNIDIMVLITNDRARIEAEVARQAPDGQAGRRLHLPQRPLDRPRRALGDLPVLDAVGGRVRPLLPDMPE